VDGAGLSARTIGAAGGCASVYGYEPRRAGISFFHTRTQGEENEPLPLSRHAGDDVEAQLAQPFPIQRAFTNRSIERLFAGWSGHRQFLAKDSVSEVLITR